MLKLKQSAAAILALSSSLAFAGTMGPVCTPGDVTVPCEQSAWDFGIQALYLQQSFNDQGANYFGRFFVEQNIDGINYTESTYVDNDIRWGWGFKLEGSYHFSTGNDITVAWYHANDNKRTQLFPANFLNKLNIDDATNNYFTTDPEWNAVNIEMGQHVDFGARKNIRFHGGFHYAKLDYRIAVHGLNGDGTYSDFAAHSKTSLFGPRLGVDASYYLVKGWSVYANAATGLLVGTSKFNDSIVTTVSGNDNATGSAKRTIVSPEVDAKLGLTYAHPFGQGTVIVDGGYLWVNYFNSTTTKLIDDSDYGVHGAYLGLKWIGTLA